MMTLKVMNVLMVGQIGIIFLMGWFLIYNPSLKERTNRIKNTIGKDELVILERERKVPHAPLIGMVLLIASVIAALVMAKL